MSSVGPVAMDTPLVIDYLPLFRGEDTPIYDELVREYRYREVFKTELASIQRGLRIRDYFLLLVEKPEAFRVFKGTGV